MTEQTKTVPAAPTTETEAGNQSSYAEETRTPIIHPVGSAVKEYGPAGQIILPHLRRGHGNARKKPEFLEATGLTDRVFRKGIESLRRAGVVVCAGDRGYYLPGSLEEVRVYIRQEEHRARSTFFTLQSARQLAAKMQAQGEQLTWGGGEM